MEKVPSDQSARKCDIARSRLLDGALRCAQRGWRLLPVKAKGKIPLLKGWPDKASHDVKQIEEWAAQHRGCNWGVATGPGSGVFVLDIDGAKGRESLAALETRYGQLPTTLVSYSGRIDGGEHRWFTCPPTANLRTSAGALGVGLDIRAAGGYVVVPPSIHPSGTAYKWEDFAVPVENAPSWLLNLLNRTSPVVSADSSIIPEGRRNKTLTSIAGGLRRKGANEDTVYLELLAVNKIRCRPPLLESDLRRIAASICRYPPTASVDMQQPLLDFVRAAIGQNGLDLACEIKWRSTLFSFTRLIKGRAELSTMDGYDAARFLDPIIVEIADSPTPWETAFMGISEDPRAEFVKTWSLVQIPAKGDPLAIARYAAQTLPLKPSRASSLSYTEFVSLAGHLQRARPGTAIALPTVRIGKLLNRDRTMVGNYCKEAEKNGLLVKVADYVPNKRATTFHFRDGLFDWETGEQKCSSH